jgi:hypothetical protein
MPKTWSIEDYEILAGDFLAMWRMYVEENDSNLSENAKKLKRLILGIMWRTLVDLDDYRQDQAKADLDKALKALEGW